MIDQPIFYMFQDGDGWKRTDEQLTSEINHFIYGTTPFNCAGRSFYPQWSKPEDKTKTRVAWRITSEGEQVVRWYWKVQDHSAKHKTTSYSCRMVNGKQCAIRLPEYLRWDDDKQFWVLVETENRASESEAIKLDKKLS